MNVTLPYGMTLNEFRKEVLNMYYSRDAVALNNLFDRVTPVVIEEEPRKESDGKAKA